MKSRIPSVPILAFFALVSVPVFPASAAELPDLTRHLSEILESTTAAVENSGAEGGAPLSESDERWFCRRFTLRLRPKASFAIPGFAKLEIVPEVEMVWQRALPTGWETYKPRTN